MAVLFRRGLPNFRQFGRGLSSFGSALSKGAHTASRVYDAVDKTGLLSAVPFAGQVKQAIKIASVAGQGAENLGEAIAE